jgi:hypothetical protein
LDVASKTRFTESLGELLSMYRPVRQGS